MRTHKYYIYTEIIKKECGNARTAENFIKILLKYITPEF